MISQPLVLFGDESMNPQFEQRPTGATLHGDLFSYTTEQKDIPKQIQQSIYFIVACQKLRVYKLRLLTWFSFKCIPPGNVGDTPFHNPPQGLLHCGSSSLSRRFSRMGFVLLLCGITLGATLPVFDTMRVEFMSLGGRWCSEIYSEKLT